jgi:hypothetical protein
MQPRGVHISSISLSILYSKDQHINLGIFLPIFSLKLFSKVKAIQVGFLSGLFEPLGALLVGFFFGERISEFAVQMGLAAGTIPSNLIQSSIFSSNKSPE